MSVYSSLLFVHVLGAMGLFAALGFEAVALGRLRRAEWSADVRVWLGLHETSFRLGGLSMAALLVSGIWMAVTAWGRAPWVAAGMVGAVLMGAVGGGLTGRRMRRLRQASFVEVSPEPSQAFRAQLLARPLVLSVRLRIGLGVGIIALMTVRPDALGSALVLAAAAVAGAIAGFVGDAPGARAGRAVQGTPTA